MTRKSLFKFLTLLIALPCVVCAQDTNSILPLIPKPSFLKQNEGFFVLSPHTKIVPKEPSLRDDAEVFNDRLQKAWGFQLPIIDGKSAGENAILLTLSNSLDQSTEAYSFSITKNQVLISGDAAGVLYGLQTLLQLIPTEKKEPWQIPCLEIRDAPRYQWRGMHLDVCRHFFPKEFIKHYIDDIAMYKMNTFHWHLTEDQGWRIEIKKYPKLTEVGAWRSGSMIGPYSDQQFDSIRYGGYYTQEDIKEIVAYATKRHVTIVPEIEMPGHSQAALASYPELSCTGGLFEVGKGWGVYEDVYCPKEETFKFLENVLTEVCALFPGKYIHIGGDECPKERWKKCGHCQALIRKEGLKDEAELQSYFIRRIETFLNAKGKQIIGWDEILEGGLAPNAAVMSWRGTEGGIAAAKQKHHAVMTPGSHCYFDYYQGNPTYEPLAIGGYTTVEKVYSYEPTPAELSADEQQYILGAQGNVWTEYMATPQHVEYMAIPRMAALAEVVWSPKDQRDYKDFQQRLMQHFKLLDVMGIQYSKAIYEVKAIVKQSPTLDGIIFAMSSPFDSTGLRYTLDGSELSINSLRYDSPIGITKNMTVTFGYFKGGKLKGNAIAQKFTISKSTGRNITLKVPPHQNYYGDGAFTLVDGIRGDFSRHGQHWLGFWGPNLEAVIDLGRPESVSKVTIDVFNGEGSWIYPPKSVEVFVGEDTTKFVSLTKLFEEEIRKMGNELVLSISPHKTRYVKLVAQNAGKIATGKPGAGNDAWLFVDEIIIE